MKNRSYIIAGLATALVLNTVAAHATGKENSTKAEKAAGSETLAKRLTLDYVNAEVVDVIRALSSQSGINVALNPNVKGQVTVHLRDKTVDEAMLLVANLAGLGAKKVNDTYVVAPRAEMREALERLGTSRHVAVTNLAPQAAVDLVEGAFPDVTAHPQGKGIALVGASEDLDAAERLLQQNDTATPSEIHTVE